MSRPSPADRARRLLDDGVNMTLATVSAAGEPWVSPVFYVPDAAYDLYWTSEVSARHSVNVRETGRCAIVVFDVPDDGPVDGVYMSCTCVELSGEDEVAQGIEVMLSRSQPEKWTISSPADVTGDGPWRIYRAHPTSIEVRAGGESGGRAVARRQPAEFRAAD